MNERDRSGRITKPAETTYTGRSVCNSCGKDMSGCWDIVCARCGKTFCYNCASDEDEKYWYCKKCYEVILRIIQTMNRIWNLSLRKI